MLNIKILGPGCANCKKLEAVAREAASRSCGFWAASSKLIAVPLAYTATLRQVLIPT